MKNSKSQQLKVFMPNDWIEKLQRLAREESIKQDKTISHLDMVRDLLNKTFNLDDSKKDSI